MTNILRARCRVRVVSDSVQVQVQYQYSSVSIWDIRIVGIEYTARALSCSFLEMQCVVFIMDGIVKVFRSVLPYTVGGSRKTLVRRKQL